jgi:hypothetical protein
MENINSIFEAVVLDWVKNISTKKYESWKHSMSDIENIGFQDEEINQMFDAKEHFQKAINAILKINNKVHECNDFHELDTYVKSIVEKHHSQSPASLNNLDAAMLDDRFATLGIENDIMHDFIRVSETYSNVFNALKKIGLESNKAEVNQDDLKYVLNNLITPLVNDVRNWSIKYPKISSLLKDDLHALADENIDLNEKWEYAEAIDHAIENSNEMDMSDIMGFMEPSAIDDTEDKMGFMKNVQDFYNGISNISKLMNVTELCSLIYTKITK